MKRYKVAVYLRLSKDDNNYNKESNSITNQKKQIEEFIINNKDLKLIDYYIDDGYSGTNFNRPGFKRLFKDLVNGKINTIIVKDLSRFGRNYIDVGNYLENIFPMYETRFISINDEIDNCCNPDSIDNIGVPLKSLMNDYYAKDISKKVKTSLETKKKNGEFIGVSAPYGYLKDPNDKHKFIIDNNTSKVVNKIFELVVLGKLRKEIAEYLNKKKILTPGQYKIKNNIANYSLVNINSRWSAEIVNKILRNEVYTGVLIQGKNKRVSYRVHKMVESKKSEWIVTENHHEPIVSKEIFDKAQNILDKRKGYFDNKDVFAGCIKCVDCGSTMITRKAKDKEYYYCSNYIRNKKCTSHSINKDKFNRLVTEDCKINLKNIEKTNLDKYIDTIYIKDKENLKIIYKNK